MPLDHPATATCTVEAAFPLSGDALPADHGVALFDALCRQTELGGWLSATDAVAIAPVRGGADGTGGLILNDESELLMRLAAADLPRVLRIVGDSLAVKGHALELGQPQIRLPSPAAVLTASLVVLPDAADAPRERDAPGDGSTPSVFTAAIRDSLAALEINGDPVIGAGGHLQLPDHSVPGFAVHLHGLSPEDSLHLQEAGLGDHRKLGCGVFLPA
ncbi:type I-MYXAN CRISPR-associated protein Cas6/Cmx6 [Thiohalocapsa halophila]|uniref:Type I-MYXAN CRISPR-associated protein Cas6/Cmx6 n=1 Tax=Thiohalocapsa halophila TaxID=69359 RepID=A0ABS1CG04_9GAMM|nr:type I-MYXAN CRISPR-associated protein Cas6/Cmx6 [Thiohalocapsa halophila]MBK1630414.1 type I-MYXAN CRISPR-associated protein Cas6/Cmx6 [Thiohalocapsa halophila]